MTVEEKAAAFDTIIDAVLNRWSDGTWSWFPLTPCGGKVCQTKEEAAADFNAWAERMGAKNRRKFAALEVMA